MSAKRKPLTPEQREAKNKRDRESKAARLAAKKTAAKPKAPAKKPAAVKKPAKPAAPKKSPGKPPVPKLGKPPVKVKITGKPPLIVPAEPTAKISQSGYTRPKPTKLDGTPKHTFRVWQIADEISAEHAKAAAEEAKRTRKKVEPQPATRPEVLAKTQAEGIPYSVFVNQFYRWRKFNGLFGRIKKDGTPAKPMGRPGPRPKVGKPRVNLTGKPPVPKVKPPKAGKITKRNKPAVKKPAKPAAPATGSGLSTLLGLLPKLESPAQTVLPDILTPATANAAAS